MVAVATFVFGLACMIVGHVPVLPLVFLALVLAGMAWIAINATISGAVHTSVAHWVRGRALAIHLLAFQGAMAGGAIFWGALATYAGTSTALALSGIGAILGLVMIRRWPLVVCDGSDLVLTPDDANASMTAQVPVHGRIVMRICYRVEATDMGEFMKALNALGCYRRRNGATRWRARVLGVRRLYQPGSVKDSRLAIVETYAFASWDDWLRYGERRVQADHLLEAAVAAVYGSDQQPKARMRVQAPLGK
jgi:MFS family permease